MLRRLQNDPRTHGLGLRRFVSVGELVKLFDFFCRQFYWISGPGTSHWHHLPDPVQRVSCLLSNSEQTCDWLYLARHKTYEGSLPHVPARIFLDSDENY